MRPALAALVLIGALAGCGGTEATDEASFDPMSAPLVTGDAGPAPTVPIALDFTAPLVDGTTFDASRYAGETVLFWFWAPY